MMTSQSFFSTPATSSFNRHPNSPTPINLPPFAASFAPLPHGGARRRRSFSQLVRASDSTTFVEDPPASSAAAVMSEEDEKDAAAGAKIGARVRVKVPLKVYHVPRVAEIDLSGKEGTLKQYVAVWKGKRISANLPFKVGFVADVEGRGPVKFFAHLKEDEFEYLD
ncbi:hypothetical protein U1Q18_022817 [Sarracenia purpurea var. burkii]